MFIAVEGPDGAGKTTLCAGLRDKLMQSGYRATVLKAPHPSVKRFCLSSNLPQEQAGDLMAGSLLALAEQISDLEGFVIVDRWTLSLKIYQQYKLLHRLESVLLAKPDLYILLSPPPETLEERIKHRDADAWDKHERAAEFRRDYSNVIDAKYSRIKSGLSVAETLDAAFDLVIAEYVHGSYERAGFYRF